jgi:hypothetical protein
MNTQAERDAQEVLDQVECCEVGGGLNPQPLPPRTVRSFVHEGDLHSVYVDGLYWGDYYIGR